VNLTLTTTEHLAYWALALMMIESAKISTMSAIHIQPCQEENPVTKTFDKLDQSTSTINLKVNAKIAIKTAINIARKYMFFF
jgi:hypothetical protein